MVTATTGLPIFAISVGLNTCDKASVQYYVQSHIQINECHDRVILVREPLKSLFNCLCPVCGKDQESTEHTCVTCAFAQTVWHLVSQWCKLRPIYAFRDWIDQTVNTYFNLTEQTKGR
ncbi:hypothetical protein HanXRQr2_Chr12g0553031 [Helianthus annuus]|uniref:Reverse transcriptase zinc-binding domain-containing protein n=1 Tax=Helianthus annuus TaxID=4232 RepID=A0A9K3HII1_HELAN|nr:hypothetical protein HanXRQr2_Chr12g0553031 [Helianthus annuus]KAJ0494396.1 hypothetical protein HanIR_Chr12g0596971 [Helianthus annuus]KAJ0863643.1 hypothetical protein HanPSC8_Chr12g0532421 [Helianthus annuus]